VHGVDAAVLDEVQVFAVCAASAVLLACDPPTPATWIT
jgi:hypothetical protein